jgi:hypothetical protein
MNQYLYTPYFCNWGGGREREKWEILFDGPWCVKQEIINLVALSWESNHFLNREMEEYC